MVIRGKSCRERSEGTIVLWRIKRSGMRTGRMTRVYVTSKLHGFRLNPRGLVDIVSPMVCI